VPGQTYTTFGVYTVTSANIYYDTRRRPGPGRAAVLPRYPGRWAGDFESSLSPSHAPSQPESEAAHSVDPDSRAAAAAGTHRHPAPAARRLARESLSESSGHWQPAGGPGPGAWR
jgi:hypothetical protein